MIEGDKKEIHLSIVVPVYNEEKRIGFAVKDILAYLENSGFVGEIIIVDDGSRDETVLEARRAMASEAGHRIIVFPENKGKGRAVKEGILASSGDCVIFTDADLSTPMNTADTVLKHLSEGSDIVIGSRALKGSEIRIRQPFVRENLGRVFNVIVHLMFGEIYRDTQCGFKGFRRGAALDIFSRVETEGFAFDVEVLWWGRKLGYRIMEIPVVWCDSRPSRLPLFGGSIKMLRELMRLKVKLRRTRKESLPCNKN